MARISLLPRNATSFETAIDKTGARIDELPVDIPKLVRPYEIPSSHLPWLAWALSVDLWRSNWDEIKKRYVTAEALSWHFKKGTAWLLRRYVGLMGGEVRRLLVPPDITFLMPALTTQERLDFLARFPELRVYPYVARATEPYDHFTTAAYGRAKAYLNASYVHDLRAWSRYTRTAEMWDHGVKTADLTYRKVEKEALGNTTGSTFEEIVLPVKTSDKLFLNEPPHLHRYFGILPYVAERLVRIKRDILLGFTAPRETINTISPGLDFISVKPEYVAERHQRLPYGSMFAGLRGAHQHQFIEGSTLPPSISWLHIYERWYLFDPDRLPEARRRYTHLKFCRLGMPAYHAEARVRIKGQSYPREVTEYVNGFLREPRPSALDDILSAARRSKSLRDKVLIDTTTYRLPMVGDRQRVGALTLGTLINKP